MIYFTGDSHFGHRGLLTHLPDTRPFDTVESMDEALITAWNRTVSPSDIVYHLGDFTLGGQEVARGYFLRLNGCIKIVPGGHDHKWCKRHWVGVVGNYHSGSGIEVEIMMPIYTLKVKNTVIVLSHYAHRVWPQSHYNSLHLYGHSHGRLPPWPNSMDVGVDAVGYEPVLLEEVIKRLT